MPTNKTNNAGNVMKNDKPEIKRNPIFDEDDKSVYVTLLNMPVNPVALATARQLTSEKTNKFAPEKNGPSKAASSAIALFRMEKPTLRADQTNSRPSTQ